eukprot:UN05888
MNDDLVLQYRWSLFHASPKNKDADQKKYDIDRVKKIVEFGNVREFWRVFNNLTPPSLLTEGSDLFLFRSGVTPQWEDIFNAKGGTWTYRLNRVQNRDCNNLIDNTWFNTILTMIGDQFDDADD